MTFNYLVILPITSMDTNFHFSHLIKHIATQSFFHLRAKESERQTTRFQKFPLIHECYVLQVCSNFTFTPMMHLFKILKERQYIKKYIMIQSKIFGYMFAGTESERVLVLNSDTSITYSTISVCTACIPAFSNMPLALNSLHGQLFQYFSL